MDNGEIMTSCIYCGSETEAPCFSVCKACHDGYMADGIRARKRGEAGMVRNIDKGWEIDTSEGQN
jgi:hypothetical protein